MSKSMIIIGAGIAGLSAGCYARMNGFDTRIFELHSIPGGLCTAWDRRGYRFDGAIRYLTGTSPATNTYSLWQELGMLDDRSIHYYETFVSFEDDDGERVNIYTDIDRLEAHLLDYAPEDEKPIRDLAEGLRGFRKMDLPVDMTPNGAEEFRDFGMDMLPVVGPVLRWVRMSINKFAQRFQNPFLREVVLPNFLQFSPPDFPMMLLLSTVSMMHDQEAGFPLGGSLKFAQDLAARYTSLGGTVTYKARVNAIIVEDDRAVGVRLDDGTEHRADIVISAADGHSTLFDLLDGKYINRKIKNYYDDLVPSKSIVQVGLGVNMDFANQPSSLDFPLSEPLILGEIPHARLVVKHYCFDASMAPEGKSVLSVWIEADYEYWKRLRIAPNRRLYREAKDALAQQIINALDHRFPGLKDAVEVVDVATPITYERYTANWRGAFAGWAMNSKKMSMMMGNAMSKTLPGLENFYMIGQWVEPGGNVQLSAASGRDVMKDICIELDREFKTTPYP